MERIISLVICLLLMLSLTAMAADSAEKWIPYAKATSVDDSDEEPDAEVDADDLFGDGKDDPEPEALVFAGASVVLYSDLSVNFKVSGILPESGYSDIYVAFSFDGKDSVLSTYSQADGKLVFNFAGIAPHQLGQTITATLYATLNGQLVEGETVTYSVSDYCYNMLETCKPENDSEGKYGELRTLLVDLLHYGAASQLYVNYNTGSLVNGALTETQLAWGSAGDPALASALDVAYATVEAPQASWKSAQLALRESVAVRVKIAVSSLEGITVKVTLGNDTHEISADELIEAGNGVYYVSFEKLNVAQLREKIYFTVYRDDAPVSNTLCYSVETYAYNNQANADAKLAELVKALIRYGDAAFAFVN